MLRLTRYLKPFWWMIVLAIALLFVQANCDLALPEYLSDIVDIGIQQGGISSAVPQAIRASQMDRLGLFLTTAEKERVLAAYTRVDSSSAEYATLLKQYPTLEKEPIYVLKGIDQAEIDALNPVVGKAILTVYGIEQMMADPAKAASMMQGSNFDLSKLPAGSDLFALLANMPVDQRSAITAKISGAITQKFSTLDSNAIVQAAASAIKAEYNALGMDIGALETGYILAEGGRMLLVSLLSVICAVIVGFLAARTAGGLARDLRRDVFTRVESFSNSEFDRFSTASLITRSTNDITQVQMLVLFMIRMIIYAPIIGVGGIIRAVNTDASMWWIIAVAVAMLVGLVATVFSFSLPKFRIMQSLVDRLNLVTRENLSGMMVIRAFNRQPFEEERFDKANQDLTGTNLFVNRVTSLMFPGMMVIMNGMSLLIIWIGAQQVAAANMQVGGMMAFLQYAMQIAFSFLMMSMMFIFMPRASVSAGRIADVLETDLSIRDPQQPENFPSRFAGTIEFDNVSFRYPHAEEDVLHEISFTALPGQTTAFIGSTGSGKSTVVNLIPRFYDVTSGAIRIDGKDIRSVTQHDLRQKIGYVPQKSSLFSGTIESNLQYGDQEASGLDLEAAAEIAQASEFIQSKAEGMTAEVAQGGMNVSGGQKQRLSIARALVKKAPIYIFDDSFSALDFRTDAALRRALKEKTSSSTLLIVTQRVSTIKNAEQIIVLDDGRVVGKGTHKELMDGCETYREIALSQLSKEELE